MSKRIGGFIGQDGLNAPDQATGVAGSAGDTQVTVSFTAPSDVGGAAITGYSVQSNNGEGSLPVPPDLNAKSLIGEFDVSSQNTEPQALFFKTDGTKMYVTGNPAPDSVYEYDLSTPWNVTTAVYLQSFNISGQVNEPGGLSFKPDGLQMFVTNNGTSSIFKYTLSSAWDISTASYSSTSASLGTGIGGIFFKPDGTKLYGVQYSGTPNAYEWALSSAWDVTSISLTTTKDISAQGSGFEGVCWSSDGTYLFLATDNDDTIFRYTASTPYSLSSTGSPDQSYETVATEAVNDIQLSSDNSQLFYVDKADDTIKQYSIGYAAGSYPTASPVTLTGLTNGTSYTFNVWAINPFGWSSPSDASGSVSPAAAFAVFIAGYNGGYYNTIDYVNISTTGNAADWGDLPYTSGYNSSCASSTRGITTGNNIGSGNGFKISYITFSSTGNSVNFGDMLDDNNAAQTNGPSGNSTRGLLYGLVYYIQYVTMATTGNSLDFGDPITISSTRFASLSSPTRTIMAGSGQDYGSNVIQYVTTATTGNGTDFGDLQAAIGFCSGAGNDTRGLIMGGYGSSPTFKDTIQYVTIASTGNSTDFGDLISGLTSGAATSSGTRAVYAGGEAASPSNVIQSVEIASTGNATDFGDLTVTRYNLGSVSNAHGGLQ
tara:strand:- start:2026 stop:3993 length:1968 start_codon:yes stop_codon:yes gene_type:complete